MYYQVATIRLIGRNLNPGELANKTGLEFVDIDRGPDFTFCDIEPPRSVENRETILWLVALIKEHYDTVMANGCELIELDVAYYHDGQCNCSLSKEELRGLADIGAEMVFSVYENVGLVERYERGNPS